MLLKKRVYVVNNSIHVLCPICNTGMRANISNKVNFCAKVKCKSCHESFLLELDYRKHYRKEFIANARVFCARNGAFDAIIKDISMGGLRFQCDDCVSQLHIDETARLQFRLDDKLRSEINVTVQVCRKYDKSEFGGIFVPEYSSGESLKKIGFWLRK